MFSITRRGKAWLVGVALLGALFVSQVPRIFHLSWTPERQGALEAYTVAVVLGVCLWFSGGALRRRDGKSHTFAFIPVQWIGAAFVGGSLTSAAFEIWGRRAPADPGAATPMAGSATPAPNAPEPKTNPPPLTPPAWHRRDTAAERASMADATKRYPELGQPDSAFRTRWKELSAEYRTTQPDYFDKPDWPRRLAEETDQSLNAKSSK